MEREEIKKQLTEIFRKAFAQPELTVEDALSANEVETWNSLSHMTMITMVEEKFGFQFSLKEIRKLKTAGDLINAIGQKV